MGSILTLKNDINTEFSIAHSDGSRAKTVSSKDIGVVVDTIADLRATVATDGIVSVIGYYSAADNIGVREYYWDATSTEADNGGTIIQVTGVVIGRWKMKYSGAVNVKWFGAKGDGVTDDTAAIQNVLNVYNNIEFDNNVTYIVTELRLHNSNSIINFNNSTIKYKDNSLNTRVQNAIIFAVDMNNIEIINLRIDGNKENQGQANDFSLHWNRGLYLLNCNAVKVYNSRFNNTCSEGLCIIGGNNIIVDNSKFAYNATVGFRLGSQDRNTTNATISNCTSWDNSSINNSGYDGYFIEKVFNSSFTNINGYYTGIIYEGGSGIKCVDVYYSTFASIQVSNNDWQGFHLHNCAYNTLSSIVSNNNGSILFPGSGAGLFLSGNSNNNVFSDCVYKENYLHGISINNTANANKFNSINISSTISNGVRLIGNNNTFNNIDMDTVYGFDNGVEGNVVSNTFNNIRLSCSLADMNFYSGQTISSISGYNEFNNVYNSSVTKRISGNIMPTLTNGWIQVPGYPIASYRKEGKYVIVTGAIKSGTIGAPAFTLPTGFRPSTTVRFGAASSGGYYQAIVSSGGEVIVGSGTGEFYLDSIIFSVL